MGKCKICDAETLNNNDLCDDCETLQDVDLIKSDEDLEELLNSMMNSHLNNPKKTDSIQDDDLSIKPISMDQNEIESQANGNSSNLFSEEDFVNSFGDIKTEKMQDIDLPKEGFASNDVTSQYNDNSDYNFWDNALSEEEPIDFNAMHSKEVPMDIDTFQREEEPIDINALLSEDEPMYIDTFQSEEKPMDINSIQSEEESMDINALQSEEEPMDINALQSEEEPMDINAFQSEEEPNDSTTYQSEDEPFDITAFQSEELVASDESSNSSDPFSFANVSGLEGIFDGIEIEEPSKDNGTDIGDLLSDVLGTVSNYGTETANYGTQTAKATSSTNANGKNTTEKVGFFKRLFANIEDEETEAQYQKELQLEEENAQKKAAKKQEKAEKVAAQKSAKAEVKKAKLSDKAAAKALAKEKIDEELAQEKSEGRINKAGVAVVFVLLATVTIFIIIGTNKFSYAVNIKQAQDYFTRHKYTKAYTQISGLDLHESDEELYKKIRTVMYVNKEYDSYNNYYAISYYAEALDSLLKGLDKYDKYLAQASELGVKSDLQYVKDLILDELEAKYELTENESMEIVNIANQEKYSEKVFDIAQLMVKK